MNDTMTNWLFYIILAVMCVVSFVATWKLMAFILGGLSWQ